MYVVYIGLSPSHDVTLLSMRAVHRRTGSVFEPFASAAAKQVCNPAF